MTHLDQSPRLHNDDSATTQWDSATARAFHLAARDADRTNLVERWGQAEPVLEQVTTIADIPAEITRSGNDQRDALLLALIRLAQGGDDTAAVTLLWVMAPWIHRSALRLFRAGALDGFCAPAEVHRNLQGRFFEVVLAYPTTRIPYGVLPRLQMDTLKQTTRRDIDHQKMPTFSLDTFEEGLPGHLAPQCSVANIDGTPITTTTDVDQRLARGHVPDRSTEVRDLLAWAVREAVVKACDAELLFDVYLADPVQSGVKYAASRHRLSAACVRQRCSRATRALAGAISARSAEQAA